MILNGYVDAKKPELYKKNSRVKTFSVQDLDSDEKYTYTLEDCVSFQHFNFRKPAKNIELTITEVYKGEKWDDTCVSAIVPETPAGGDNELYQEQPLSQSYTSFSDKENILDAIKEYTSKYTKYEPDTDK